MSGSSSRTVMTSPLFCCCEVMSATVAGTGTENVTFVKGPPGYCCCCSTTLCGFTDTTVRRRSLDLARSCVAGSPHAIQPPDCVLSC